MKLAEKCRILQEIAQEKIHHDFFDLCETKYRERYIKISEMLINAAKRGNHGIPLIVEDDHSFLFWLTNELINDGFRIVNRKQIDDKVLFSIVFN